MRLLILPFCFLVFVLSGPAQARDKILDIQEVSAPAGIKAWLVEDHSIPIISLKFSFKGNGAALDPPDKQGLARMASNTMDEGAGDIESQAFQEELRNLSITLSFNSSRDGFGGNLKTLSKNKARAFELLTLALTEPRFDEAPIERMRRANKSRLRSSLSNPDWIAARIINDKAFSGHPYAQNSGGTLSTLDNITAEDLKAFSKTLSRDKLYVAAAGDITAGELSGILGQVFGTLPEKADVPAVPDLSLQNGGDIFLYKNDIPQTVIEIMQPGIDRKDPDFQTAQIMNFILGGSGFGSRLTREIREKRGLSYGVHSYFLSMDHTDPLSVSTSTKNETVTDVLSIIKNEWQTMIGEPVSETELKDAKSYLIGSLPLALTSTDKISGLLLSLQLDELPIDYLDQRKARISEASPENIQRVAKRLLTPDKLITVLVGQPENIDNAQLIETLPNVE